MLFSVVTLRLVRRTRRTKIYTTLKGSAQSVEMLAQGCHLLSGNRSSTRIRDWMQQGPARPLNSRPQSTPDPRSGRQLSTPGLAALDPCRPYPEASCRPQGRGRVDKMWGRVAPRSMETHATHGDMGIHKAGIERRPPARSHSVGASAPPPPSLRPPHPAEPRWRRAGADKAVGHRCCRCHVGAGLR
eukprot:gene10477-biopygen7769